MNAHTKKIFQEIRDYIDKKAMVLAPAEYKDLLDELKGQIESYLDCWWAEHPEDK